MFLGGAEFNSNYHLSSPIKEQKNYELILIAAFKIFEALFIHSLPTIMIQSLNVIIIIPKQIRQ